MRKTFSNLIYTSDCNAFKLSVKKIKDELSNSELIINAFGTTIVLENVSELINMRDFFNECINDINGATKQELPKSNKVHDPRFAPDPDGVLNF